jgi:hypothetical protein
MLDGDVVATVGARFHLKMAVTNGGHYEIYTDGKLAGRKIKPSKKNNIDIRFGLKHDSHCCALLSHAYISDIMMLQGENENLDGIDTIVETWDD